MASKNHHGMMVPIGMDLMAKAESTKTGSFGRFGRLFGSLSPLYTTPSDLIELGGIGGPMDNGNNSTPTNTIPLGMVFLGQFIDHDITFDTSSKFGQINQPEDIENIRTPALDLDCIFGGGPEDEPFMYATDSLKLLTGLENKNYGQSVALREFDLARNGLGRAIIGDPRNDENRIISQLQLTFIKFYNVVYDEIALSNPSYSDMEVYEEARRIVTWHYQWIVVNEFLPLMTGEKMVDQVLSEGRKWYTPKSNVFIPIEFSVAAYRFGHSMIAEEMQLQANGQVHSIFSPQIGVGFTEISNEDQIVEWELFFDLDGNFQKAEKLDTRLASSLLDLPFIPSPDPAAKSLAIRNLMRGQSFLLPSGESVANHMERGEVELGQVQNHIQNLLIPHDINLGQGTPLWFYLLAESDEIGRADFDIERPGEGLGPVGATIVAETLIGLLELDPNSYLGSNRNWQPTLGNFGNFGMADLILKTRTPVPA